MEKKVILSFESKGQEQLLDGITDLEKANVYLRKEQKRLNTEIKNSKVVDKEKVKELVEVKNGIKENNTAIREQTKLYQASINQNKEVDDSIKGIGKSLSLKRAQYDNLSKSERENEKVGGALLIQIRELDEQYKDLTASTGRFQSSVGDYSNAIQDVIDGKTNLKKSLREMKEELVNMTLAGKEGTQGYIELRDQVAGMEDALAKVNTETKRFSNDFKVVQDVVDMTNFMAQGFTLVKSATALMGVESEKLEKTLVQLVAVGNLANSVNNMSNIIMKNQHVLTKITIGLKALWTKSIWAVNAGLSAMQVLLSALGIGLIIAAIAALVKWWDYLVDAVKRNIDIILVLMGPIGWLILGIKKLVGANKEVIEETENYIDVLNRLVEAQDKNVKSMEKEIERMRAKGKSIDEIKKKERELLEAQIEAQRIRLKLAFMESASLDKTAEERAEASKKFMDETEKLDDLYHKLEIFDITERKRQEEQTDKLEQETQKRIEIRNKEIQKEQEKLDEINRRNELAQAELDYLLNSTLEKRIALEDVKHKQRLENSKMTQKEIELAELQHQNNIQRIIDEAADEMKVKDDERKEIEKTADEIEREQQREIYLNELEQRRLAEMDYFEERKELLDDWLQKGVLTEQEYTNEIERAHKKRIESEKSLAQERALINMAMTATLLNNLSHWAEANERMFLFQQRAGQLEALINTYVGITQVLRDSTLPTYAKIVAVAAVLSTGLSAVMKIQNQPRPNAPTFRDGGSVLIKGPSHELGGVPIWAGTQYVGEAEGNEIINIVSKKDAKKANLMDGIRNSGSSIISGKRWFRDGGSFEPRADFGDDMTERIKEMVKEIAYIPVVVSVRDINDGQDELRDVEIKGNLM